MSAEAVLFCVCAWMCVCVYTYIYIYACVFLCANRLNNEGMFVLTCDWELIIRNPKPRSPRTGLSSAGLQLALLGKPFGGFRGQGVGFWV